MILATFPDEKSPAAAGLFFGARKIKKKAGRNEPTRFKYPANAQGECGEDQVAGCLSTPPFLERFRRSDCTKR